ncbi:MAG TPA: DUF58 domain-containing protein [Candidatus Dojkabacteria bacterium]|jgi:uncharacterized protein (DUF58 family)
MNQFGRQVKQLELSTNRKVLTHFIGNYISAFKGQGIEFNDLREYIPGDSIKDIDWNSTAKTGALHVRKYIETRELILLFAVDSSSSMNWAPIPNYSKKDLVLNIITLLSLASERSSDRIGAAIFTDKLAASVDFRKGRSHMLKILKEVTNAISSSFFKDSNMNNILSFLLDGLKKRTICFLFTDQLDLEDKATLKKLKAVNKKHELVFVHVDDAYEILKDINEIIEVQDIESGEIIKIDFSNKNLVTQIIDENNKYREQMENFFRRSKISYLYINQNTNLLLELINFFDKKSKQRAHF